MSVSDFLSDFADVDVDRAVADDHAVAPDAGVDLFPGEEFSGRGGEQGEQGELLAGQFDTFSVADYQMSFPVDDQRSRFVGGYPFEDRPDAAYQKCGLDRLGNIVVGSGSEPCELLLLSPRAERKTTIVSFSAGSQRRARQVSMPSIVGIITSSRIRCGRCAAACCKPSAPLRAVYTS